MLSDALKLTFDNDPVYDAVTVLEYCSAATLVVREDEDKVYRVEAERLTNAKYQKTCVYILENTINAKSIKNHDILRVHREKISRRIIILHLYAAVIQRH